MSDIEKNTGALDLAAVVVLLSVTSPTTGAPRLSRWWEEEMAKCKMADEYRASSCRLREALV